MTIPDHASRAVTDPIGLVTDLVTRVEKELGPETIRAVVTAVAGGRAKSRMPARRAGPPPSGPDRRPVPGPPGRR